MNILNDKIEFEAADFDGLSPIAKRALETYLPNYVEFFATQANSQISSATSALKTAAARDPRTDSILTGLASADEIKLLQAEPLLNQLNAVLNDLPLPEPEAAASEESSSLWSAVTSFFK